MPEDTLKLGVGFLARFVYIKASLTDLKSGMTLGEKSMTASRVMGTSRSEHSFDPWDALTPEEKVGLLRQLLEQEVAAGVPELVAH